MFKNDIDKQGIDKICYRLTKFVNIRTVSDITIRNGYLQKFIYLLLIQIDISISHKPFVLAYLLL
jgi:hypothetical protein